VKRDEIIAKLRAHEPELKASGIVSLSVFGSVARGEERPDSDIDIVVRLSEEAARGGFSYFGCLEAVSRRLGQILGQRVDVVAEPVHKDRLRRNIEKERALAF
jgi:predicted nucleotidyltransferase